MTLDPEVVRERADAVRAEVAEAARRTGRDPGGVEILAATKYLEAGDLPALAAAGLRRAGENRADALAGKQRAGGELFAWDFIGHLQSRKARDVVGRVELIHALESLSTADAIERRAEATQDVLVEVNVSRDAAKYGVLAEDLDGLLEHLAGLSRVQVRGVMTMPPAAGRPDDSRRPFADLRDLAARCAERWAPDHRFDVLSMGTSQDYVVAVEEGATIVRLGGVLYGGRPQR